MTYPISEIKTILHIIYLVLFHHNYLATPSRKSQCRTHSSPNHIRKRISQRAPDDYERFLFVLWRWNSRKRGALWRTRFLLLRRFIGMVSTMKLGIIVGSPLNIYLFLTHLSLTRPTSLKTFLPLNSPISQAPCSPFFSSNWPTQHPAPVVPHPSRSEIPPV